MRRGKLLGKLFGTTLVFVLVGSMVGGLCFSFLPSILTPRIVEANPGWDFVIDILGSHQNTYARGEEAEMIARIMNTGTERIDAYYAEAEFEIITPDGQIAFNGKDWNGWPVEAGAPEIFFAYWTIPLDAAAGYYSLRVTVTVWEGVNGEWKGDAHVKTKQVDSLFYVGGLTIRRADDRKLWSMGKFFEGIEEASDYIDTFDNSSGEPQGDFGCIAVAITVYNDLQRDVSDVTVDATVEGDILLYRLKSSLSLVMKPYPFSYSIETIATIPTIPAGESVTVETAIPIKYASVIAGDIIIGPDIVSVPVLFGIVVPKLTFTVRSPDQVWPQFYGGDPIYVVADPDGLAAECRAALARQLSEEIIKQQISTWNALSMIMVASEGFSVAAGTHGIIRTVIEPNTNQFLVTLKLVPEYILLGLSVAVGAITGPKFIMVTPTLAQLDWMNPPPGLAEVHIDTQALAATLGDGYVTTNNSDVYLELTIDQVRWPLTLPSCGELPVGRVGVAYEAALEATGGSMPYAWEWAVEEAGQRLPPGLGLDAETGMISGIPTEAGTFNFTLQVTDAVNSTAVGNLSIRIIEIAEIQLLLMAGWNMASVPVMPAGNSASAVFPGVAAIFTWNATSRSYYVPTVIEPEKGYWVAVTENTTVTISGTPIETWTTDIKAGWNMIGSVNETASIADPNDDPDGSIIPTAYWWDPVSKSYVLTTDIEPGKGYWLASVNDCILTL